MNQKCDTGKLISVFDSLIKRHRILTRDSISLPTQCVQLKSLLDQYVAKSTECNEDELQQALRNREQFGQLLNSYNAASENWRLNQEATAEEFNLFDVMNLTGDEIRHSMLLAWLLDHRLTAFGTHGQGRLGFRVFLEELGLPVEYAEKQYSVHREVSGDRSRIDIRIQARGFFIIDIENKIWSVEGNDQTNSEWEDLQQKAKELSVSDVCALFLTPNGTEAENPNFRSITWRQIIRVLERFAREAKPPEVRLFAKHYADALRRFVVIESPTPENDYEKNI
jgi:hypothetical protein